MSLMSGPTGISAAHRARRRDRLQPGDDCLGVLDKFGALFLRQCC